MKDTMNLLAIGTHKGAKVTSFSMEEYDGTHYVRIGFRVGNHLSSFLGSLLRDKSVEKDPRYYTLANLANIGYEPERKSFFPKECIGKEADVKVEHTVKNGTTYANISRIYKLAKSASISFEDALGDDDAPIPNELAIEPVNIQLM